MLVWLDFCQDLGYLDEEIVTNIKQEYVEISKMLYKLSQNWIIKK